eukprot:scaffold2627_cov122-Skeletonema_marinoi.AAC.1
MGPAWASVSRGQWAMAGWCDLRCPILGGLEDSVLDAAIKLPIQCGAKAGCGLWNDHESRILIPDVDV